MMFCRPRIIKMNMYEARAPHLNMIIVAAKRIMKYIWVSYFAVMLCSDQRRWDANIGLLQSVLVIIVDSDACMTSLELLHSWIFYIISLFCGSDQLFVPFKSGSLSECCPSSLPFCGLFGGGISTKNSSLSGISLNHLTGLSKALSYRYFPFGSGLNDDLKILCDHWSINSLFLGLWTCMSVHVVLDHKLVLWLICGWIPFCASGSFRLLFFSLWCLKVCSRLFWSSTHWYHYCDHSDIFRQFCDMNVQIVTNIY